MIPEKLPKGTTREQWERYEKDLKWHKDYMEEKRPFADKHETWGGLTYQEAKSKWDMAYFCDAPNEPGYYRANND